MSDPARDGPYTCCQAPMRAVTLFTLDPPSVVYLCEQCGVWRHALPVGDPRRPEVERHMAVILSALFAEHE